jgi:hypothetical protein
MLRAPCEGCHLAPTYDTSPPTTVQAATAVLPGDSTVASPGFVPFSKLPFMSPDWAWAAVRKKVTHAISQAPGHDHVLEFTSASSHGATHQVADDITRREEVYANLVAGGSSLEPAEA